MPNPTALLALSGKPGYDAALAVDLGLYDGGGKPLDVLIVAEDHGLTRLQVDYLSDDGTVGAMDPETGSYWYIDARSIREVEVDGKVVFNRG